MITPGMIRMDMERIRYEWAYGPLRRARELHKEVRNAAITGGNSLEESVRMADALYGRDIEICQLRYDQYLAERKKEVAMAPKPRPWWQWWPS